MEQSVQPRCTVWCWWHPQDISSHPALMVAAAFMARWAHNARKHSFSSFPVCFCRREIGLIKGLSRPGWMGLWATWSTSRSGVLWPCLWQAGWNLKILGVPFSPRHSMNLWITFNLPPARTEVLKSIANKLLFSLLPADFQLDFQRCEEYQNPP